MCGPSFHHLYDCMQTRSDRNRLSSSISRVTAPLNVCRDAWAWDTRRWQQGSEATVIINPWLIWVEAITTSHVALVPSEGGHTHPPDSAHTHPFGLGSQHFDCFFWRRDTFDEVCAACLKQKRRERGSRSEIHHYVVQNILVFQAKSQAVVSRQPIRVNAVCVIHVTCFSCERTIILGTFPSIRYRGERVRR